MDSGLAPMCAEWDHLPLFRRNPLAWLLPESARHVELDDLRHKTTPVLMSGEEAHAILLLDSVEGAAIASYAEALTSLMLTG
jgi:hypothetical protein